MSSTGNNGHSSTIAVLDVGGSKVACFIAQVQETGERVSMEPMSPFERKVVHDVVAAAGLQSESAGAEPRRHVVVLPA